jgi:hypothetical protein
MEESVVEGVVCGVGFVLRVRATGLSAQQTAWRVR